MGITDELKKRATQVKGIKFTDLECLLLMMKRIDQAHTSALETARRDGYNAGYNDASDELTDAGKLPALGWVPLPRDADGETIRVGDTLDGYNNTTVVKGLTLSANGWDMVCNNGLWHDPEAFTHHHEPDTWERIIADAYQGGYIDPDNEEMRDRLIERCKALAGEDA